MDNDFVRNCEDYTVKELAERWLFDRKANVKASSYNAYVSSVTKWITPILGSLKVSEVSYTKKQEFIHMLEEGGLLESTVQNIFNCLERILNTEPEEKMEFKSSESRGIRVLSDDEIKKLMEFCSMNSSFITLAIMIVLGTGIKLGELMSLKWKQVDFINRNLVFKETDELSGQQEERKIFIPEMLCKFLIKHRRNKEIYIIGGDAIRGDRRKQQYNLTSLGKHLGIDSLTFNSLRNTYIVRTLKVGVSPVVLQESLGLTIESLKRYFPLAGIDEEEERSKFDRLYP